MTTREILERDWSAESCDYRARLRLFYIELSLSRTEAEKYAKMSFVTLPEIIQKLIEDWYVRQDHDGKRKK